MSHYEIAATLSEALGVTIIYEPVSSEAFAGALRSRGYGEHTVQHLSNVAHDYRNGVFTGTRAYWGKSPAGIRIPAAG